MGNRKNFATVQREIGLWGRDTFGEAQSIPGLVNHISLEAAELALGAESMSYASIKEECADIIILMCSLAFYGNFDLQDEVEKKMAVNKKRRWGAADANGVVQHL